MQEGRKVIQLPNMNPICNDHYMICGVLRRALRTNNDKGPWNKLFNLQMLCHKISHCKLQYLRPQVGKEVHKLKMYIQGLTPQMDAVLLHEHKLKDEKVASLSKYIWKDAKT
jgi:hypothetical protein